MLYEEPKMEVMMLQAEDVITMSAGDDTTTALSGGNGGSDTIEGSNNPWQK